MVSPPDSMHAVARAVARSGILPDEMGVLLHEADLSFEDADVDLPVIQFEPTTIDYITIHNDDLAGYITDDDGNRVGRLYQVDYEMDIQIDIWVTPDDNYDVRELGERLRNALYQHSSYVTEEPFVDEDGNTIDEISHFEVGDAERADDLLRTPSVRRWRQNVELHACEMFPVTGDTPITDVSYPSDGGFSSSGTTEIDST